ncbi:MAG TPA: DUF58 domain-containing protein [Pirellulaceae bacterium]|nr:DUF58 domain-containing protein [Pirellulaceae bacterium]HMO93256.1 DUF58 domain-containing protein [Pirellulaceae bacterium]HMP69121.1 DUF58 domain-containing protein [Pirellulaceae bacterium]
MSVQEYLKPEVINQIKRLDLRAKFVVKGFLQGLHASPFHGFSVEFSEHRKYTPGDDPAHIDWRVYAKTDKYYIKKFEAETNIVGMLVMDASESMGYTYQQDLTKFDYAVCLAAALAYLMLSQQDPVGLITFKDKIKASVPPRSKRTQLGNILSLLAQLKPEGPTDLGGSLVQLSAMLKTRTLVMIFSDLLEDEEKIMDAIFRLKHGGHDVIVFHILDEAEVNFPFQGLCELEDPESRQRVKVDATGFRSEYKKQISEFRESLTRRCQSNSVDFVPLDTSMPFDRALMEYLLSRRARC